MKKLLSIITALALLPCTALSVSADTQTIAYNSISDSSASTTSNVGVEVEKAELYSVTLPKTISLEVNTETGVASHSFNIDVTGEISSNHYVRVIPYDTASILDEDEILNYKLKVEQDKKRWDYTEVGQNITATGKYTPVNEDGTDAVIEPGKYTGVVQYYISCDDTGLWSPATCTTPATCVGYDTNDNGILDWGEDLNQNHVLDDGEDTDADGVLDTEYLATEATKGSSLGHQFADDDIAIPSTCTRCKKPVYAIRTPEQLVQLSTNVNSGTTYSGACIELTNDIDMSGIDNFVPIGNYTNPFKGNFDGNNYTIHNLKINAQEVDYVGFFGYASCGFVRDLTIKDMQLKANTTTGINGYGYNYVGLLGASLHASEVSNVHLYNVNADIKMNMRAGTSAHAAAGFILFTDEIIVQNCSVAGSMIVDVGESTDAKTYYFVGSCDSTSELKNNFIAMNLVTNQDRYVTALYGVYQGYENLAYVNSVFDYELANVSNSSTFINALDTAQCKSQTALDILNTDNTEYIWVLDMEGKADGYPVIRN